MLVLFGNHIVSFPTRWLKLVQRQVVIIVVPPHGKTNNLHRRKQRPGSASPLLSKSKISSLLPSVTVQSGLCRTWLEPKSLVFSRTGSVVKVLNSSIIWSLFPGSEHFTALVQEVKLQTFFSVMLSAFYTPPLKKVRGIMLYPQKKFAFECPSVRLSVRQRFVSGLYLEHLLTDFLQTLYRSLYQEGVV